MELVASLLGEIEAMEKMKLLLPLPQSEQRHIRPCPDGRYINVHGTGYIHTHVETHAHHKQTKKKKCL